MGSGGSGGGGSPTATIDVAFGTLRNGAATNDGGLGSYINQIASTTVNAGATVDVHDFNMEVRSLQGAGVVTLGTNAATALDGRRWELQRGD